MATLNIAGLDCFVEGDVLRLPYFQNYWPFLAQSGQQAYT